MDSVYDQVCWQQDAPDTGARSAQLRAEFLARFGPPERYAYGPSAVEGLDLYRTPAGKGNAPTMIYIHGGAWRGGSAAGSGSMAENFVSAGANLVALDFINVIQSGGNLLTMAEQVRAGGETCIGEFAGFGEQRFRRIGSHPSKSVTLS